MIRSEREPTSCGSLRASPKAGMTNSGAKPSANLRTGRRTTRTKSPKPFLNDGTASADFEVSLCDTLTFLTLVPGAVMSHESQPASLGGLYPENPILVLSALAGEATAEE